MLMDWVGSSLGRYRIDRMVGRGGMGLVFRAHDPELQRWVAIKVLYPHLVTDANLVERFRREARIAANLRHPHIVAIYDVGQEAGRHFLVMEYLDGRPLSSILEDQGALPVEVSLEITAQMAKALDHIHKRGLVHRDVKAGNIIVEKDGRAVLTDFGIVRALVGGTLTASGTVLGTTPYLAPEQISLGGVGPWTDLYALGVVVYEMLTGDLPFEAASTAALLFRVVQQAPPSISEARESLHPAVDEVLGRMLSKDPRQRYSSGEAFVAALERVLTEGEVDIAKVTTPRPSEAVPAATTPFSPPTAPASSVASAGMTAPGTRLVRPDEFTVLRKRRALPAWFWAAVGGLLVLLIVGGALMAGGVFSGSASPTAPAVVVAATASATPASPGPASPTSAGESPQATAETPILPTDTPAQPTSTSAVVQPTPVPPTSTPVPPTSTPIPPTSVPPTDTPRPPTRTPAPTTPPTATPEPTSTHTPMPTIQP
jgi:serine/threonine-protein kinase